MKAVKHRLTDNQHKEVLANLKLCSELFPKAFPPIGGDPVHPLQVNINKELHSALKAAGHDFTVNAVKRLLNLWCKRGFYIKSFSKVTHRVDLYGNHAGDLTPEEIEHAQQRAVARQQRFMQAAIEKTSETNTQKKEHSCMETSINDIHSLLLPAEVGYPESILGVSNEHVSLLLKEGFNPGKECDYFPFMQSGLVIGQRQWLDFVPNKQRQIKTATTEKGDNTVRQLLPYVTLKNARGEVLPYLRGKTVSEDRLANKVSIGFGGHIDGIDVHFSAKSVIDLMETVRKNLARELTEELVVFVEGSTNSEDADVDLLSSGTFSFKGFINDNSDQVGRLHLAMWFEFNLKEGLSAKSREVELITLPWQKPEGLMDMESYTLESWSQLCLKG